VDAEYFGGLLGEIIVRTTQFSISANFQLLPCVEGIERPIFFSIPNVFYTFRA